MEPRFDLITIANAGDNLLTDATANRICQTLNQVAKEESSDSAVA